MSDRDDQSWSERDALAAEHALGVLDGAARREAEALVASDPEFAARVEHWRAELAPLVETVPAVTPSASVWQRIEAELSPAPQPRPAPERGGFWSSLAFWRGLSFASMATAAALAAMLLTPRPVPAPVAAPPTQMAAAPVRMEGGSALVAAAYDPAQREIIVTPTGTVELRPTQSLELWIIVGDKAPRSLGVIDPASPRAHVLPADVRADLAMGAALAVSIEPTGGSPTGAPTGPVVAQGKLITI